MSVLTVNLKHLYQHRGLWLQYFLLAWLAYMAFTARSRIEYLVWVWYVLINFIAGLALGGLQREILSKPFTYCLPGHRPVPHRIIGMFGIVLNLLLSSLVVVRRDLAGLEAVIIMAAAFSLGLAIYLVVARSMLTLSDRTAPFLVVQMVFMGLLFAKGRAVGDLIFARPDLVAALSLAVCAAVWMNLSADVWARRFCGQPVQNLGDFSKASIERNQKVRQRVRGESPAVQPQVENLFLARIEASRPLSTARCIWADLYVTFAGLLSQWKLVLFTCLPVACLLAYAAAKASALRTGIGAVRFPATLGVLLFTQVIFASLIPTVKVPVQVFSSMLLTRGRRERFAAAVSIAGAMALLVSCLLILITACTSLLEYVAPGTLASVTRLFGAVPAAVLVVAPFAVVPLGLVGRLVAKYLDMTIVGLLVLCVLILILTVGHWLEWIAVPLLALASAGSWLVFILATRRISTKASLAK